MKHVLHSKTRLRLCTLPLALALLSACASSAGGSESTPLASSLPAASAQPAAASEPDRSSMPAWAQAVALLEPDSFREDGKIQPDSYYSVRWTEQDVEQAQQALLAGRQPEQLDDTDKFNYTLLEYYRFGWSAEAPLEGVWEPLYEGEIGETLEIDLNGDGEPDTLQVEREDREIVVTVNDVSCSIDVLADAFCIVDIDPSDPYLEIYLYSYMDGYFVCYDGEQIIDMLENCSVPLLGTGLYGFQGIEGRDEEQEKSKLWGIPRRIVEGGIVETHRQSSMIMTYFIKLEYRLTDGHRLEAIPVDFYEMNIPQFVYDPGFAVYSEPDLAAERLPLDDYCIIWVTGTDAVRWVQIEMPDGQIGWIYTQHGSIYDGEAEYGRYLFDTPFAG